MSFTIADLRKAIAGAPEDADVMLMHEGKLRQAVGVTVAPNGAMCILRFKGNPRGSSQYNITEDGLIGGLNAMGMSDQLIAELLERTVDGIKRRKKKLGLS